MLEHPLALVPLCHSVLSLHNRYAMYVHIKSTWFECQSQQMKRCSLEIYDDSPNDYLVCSLVQKSQVRIEFTGVTYLYKFLQFPECQWTCDFILFLNFFFHVSHCVSNSKMFLCKFCACRMLKTCSNIVKKIHM